VKMVDTALTHLFKVQFRLGMFDARSAQVRAAAVAGGSGAPAACAAGVGAAPAAPAAATDSLRQPPWAK